MSTIIVVLLSSVNVIAVMLNLLAIYTFFRIRSQLTLMDYLLVGMLVSDLIRCLFGYPVEIYSSHQGQWKLDLTTCKV